MKRLLCILSVVMLLGGSILGCTATDGMIDDIYTQNVYPSDNVTYDLGSTDFTWDEGHFNDLFVDGSAVSAGGGVDADAIHDNVAGEIAAIAEKGAPAAADMLIIEDSADGNSKKRVQITNLPAGGAHTLDGGQSDVTIAGVADNEVLAYDLGTTEWINQTPLEAGLADTTHAATHTDGTDDIQDATAAQKGLMTLAYAGKLDGIDAGATDDQTGAEMVTALEALAPGAQLSHDQLDDVSVDDHHTEAHTVVSHSDTTATGAELDILTGGGETALHSHAGGGGATFTVSGVRVVNSQLSPTTWTDLDLSGTVGANSVLVALAFTSAGGDMDATAVRMNGDGYEYYHPSAEANAYGMQLGHHEALVALVLMCVTDTAGVIEWKTESEEIASIKLLYYIK